MNLNKLSEKEKLEIIKQGKYWEELKKDDESSSTIE